MRLPLILFFLAALVGLGVIARDVMTSSSMDPVRASLTVDDFMGAQAPAGFQRALEPRPFQFPRDHGPHSGFRTEWWYLTGNLEGPGGVPYGFQFTIFRSALAPEAESPPAQDQARSDWRTNQLYMGHFAVTDGGGAQHRAFEAFARGAQGLAGAQADPFRVWLGDWELAGPGGQVGWRTGYETEGALGEEAAPERLQEPDGIFPLTLRGTGEDAYLHLSLIPEKPMVLQGRDGLSQKGPEAGNASFYYSFTRLSASGLLILEGDSVPVTGQAWMDREWSTSALSQGQVGWDWFALQLDDGHDLMFYQLRREDGSADPNSKGAWVDPEGRKESLSLNQVLLEVVDTWRSDLDGTRYPSGWRLRVPSLQLDLEILPIVPDQEMELTFRYWEGAVSVRGARAGSPIQGVGYVELTGYADRPTEASGRRVGRTGGE